MDGSRRIRRKHRQLLAQHQDLDILRRLGTDQQHQPARKPEKDQIEQVEDDVRHALAPMSGRLDLEQLDQLVKLLELVSTRP
ncbi:hypothetical protein [Microtetraspora malaysiensis]|uniref:Uncharacterized protein n=1 Tax=Microtetraspora malaysiensis TaxID=161358 RepID=A0ABW6SLJ5_9ACTN